MSNENGVQQKSSFEFYPSDWLSDTKLNLCSYSTKGVWIDLLCYMHKADPYGYLIVNGIILNEADIQGMLKLDNKSFNYIWSELVNYGVIKKDDRSGAFYSKRMVNDHKKRLKDKEFSKKVYETSKKVIGYLNQQANKKFKHTFDGNLNLIHHRLNEGYTMTDMKNVIDIKCEEWGRSKDMNNFLRPETLFGNKFDRYVNQYHEEIEKIRKKKEKKSSNNTTTYQDLLKKEKG